MNTCILTPQKLAKTDTTKLSKIIYNNFIQFSSNPNIKHSVADIEKILHCDTCQFYIIVKNNGIIAYLLGEIIDVNDGRFVFYIDYLYTVPSFRKKGLGNSLMNLAEKISYEKKLDGILLTCDTENKEVFQFYTKLGFLPDLHLRKYERHDILYKIL